MSEYEIGKDIQDLQTSQAELYQRISTLEQDVMVLLQNKEAVTPMVADVKKKKFVEKSEMEMEEAQRYAEKLQEEEDEKPVKPKKKVEKKEPEPVEEADEDDDLFEGLDDE